jgi:hypothetical protein
MKHPSQPDLQRDEYIPDAKGSHRNRTATPGSEGINPRDTSSMPRGEDDERTRANSPEFHDRPPAAD